jgi:hypothetical protein
MKLTIFQLMLSALDRPEAVGQTIGIASSPI